MKKLLFIAVLFAAACNNNDNPATPAAEEKIKPLEAEPRANITYSLVAGKDSVKKFMKSFDSAGIGALIAVNRKDRTFLLRSDTLLVPSDVKQKVQHYLPFPFKAEALRDINKIILFSYPAQAFAAYENGMLKYTGPTSMGRRADPTPTGLFYANWKAEETTSTFNDEWELKWNFNIENKLGVGFHQYEMPGYPASHSCLRMTETDAKFMYEWTEQWDLEGTDNILAHGTPVVVFGAYPFGSARPWLALAQNPNALTIPEEAIAALVQPHTGDIMAKQKVREGRATGN